MGKDREGKYHPPKGKPSVANTQKGVTTTNSSILDQQLEVEDKYDIQADADEIAASVRVRHPNRNVDKGTDRKTTEKKNQPKKAADDKSKTEITSVSIEELSPFLSKDGLQEIANYTANCCVSVYIPMHPSGVVVNEQMNQIAFKNALQQVESTLKQRQFDQQAIAGILKPGFEMLRNDAFWYSLSDGLAVFMADGYFKFMKLPTTPTEKILINTSFYLTPLVPFFLSKEYFYLLVISKKQAKLFRADNFGMKYIEVKELPNGVDDVVHFEEKDDQKLFRTGSSGAGEGANYHGIGGGKPDEKENISMYLEEVDETLWKEILHNEHAPLLLAGVEYLIPLFKKVSHYQYIWDKNITGNMEYADDQQLYSQARELMEPHFRERLNKAKETYGNQSATALTSSVVEDVIPAAYYSRISQLFIVKDAQIWGTFNEQENKLTVHEQQEEQDDSLIDKAVMKTILNGGDVFIVDKENMPAQGSMAALMRY